ncbi:MAG: hypothetical protein ACU843_13855 [Gammaproteobacteria bacterium]
MNTFEIRNNVIDHSSNPPRNSGVVTSQTSRRPLISDPGVKYSANKGPGFVKQLRVDLCPRTDGFVEFWNQRERQWQDTPLSLRRQHQPDVAAVGKYPEYRTLRHEFISTANRLPDPPLTLRSVSSGVNL